VSGWCQTILLLHIGDTKYLQNSEIRRSGTPYVQGILPVRKRLRVAL
jgi:hypothetical protein